MRAHSTKNYFEPRARLLIQLGDKLIKNENVALLELIKNSYDADARSVTISLRNLDKKLHGVIDILDDGIGMDMKVIEDAWLEPGSDHKSQLLKERVRTPKYKRLPIGEKGIGRFGVHKLGNKIELISRKAGGNEVVVRIDWNAFSQNKYLKDAKFEVFERTPEYFLSSRTGTRITITDLRTDWDARMIRDLYKSVLTLNSPFSKPGNFKVDFNIDDASYVEDLPRWSDIQELALWHFRCTLKGSEIVDFEYEFKPAWLNLPGLKPRTVTLDSEYVSNRSRLVIQSKGRGKEEIVVNLDKNYGTSEEPATIGPVTFEGYIFDRDRSVMELAKQQSSALLKKYLDEQGGIRVYRDNIRVNEYGEKSNDWLHLDIRRVNLPAKRISNNIILAVIDLDLANSKALIEKTNREGFIENDAFNDFCMAILYVLGIVENLRRIDKDDVRAILNPNQQEEPVIYHLGELRSIVSNKLEDGATKVEILTHLDQIERDYDKINEILVTSAGAGLTLAFGIHEVEKVVSELKVLILQESIPERVQLLVRHLNDLIDNYGDMLRQSDNSKESLFDVIEGALFNVEFRLKAHGIALNRKYLTHDCDMQVTCSKRLLMGAIINVLDNAIYWLERKYAKQRQREVPFNKQITVDVQWTDSSEYADIIIADNGTGFDLPIYQVTKPFITGKVDGGMGLGLHIVSEAMKIQNGKVLFPTAEEVGLVEEAGDGAVVALRLNRATK